MSTPLLLFIVTTSAVIVHLVTLVPGPVHPLPLWKPIIVGRDCASSSEALTPLVSDVTCNHRNIAFRGELLQQADLWIHTSGLLTTFRSHPALDIVRILLALLTYSSFF
jgi:hypothetical protein